MFKEKYLEELWETIKVSFIIIGVISLFDVFFNTSFINKPLITSIFFWMIIYDFIGWYICKKMLK